MKTNPKVLAMLALVVFSSFAALGCGENVNTDVDSVNKGKGEQVTVTPRNRDAAGQTGR